MTGSTREALADRPANDRAYAAAALPPGRLLDTGEEILQARRLQAQEYVRVGYVPSEAVGPDGTITADVDPWIPYSRHFGAFDDDGNVLATSRVISNSAPWPLPTLQLPGLDPAVRAELEALPPGQLGEISALARHPGGSTDHTRSIFRAMWLDAHITGITDWILCVDTLVLRTLRRMDARLFRVVGEPSPAPVRPILPVRARFVDVNERIFTYGLAVDRVVLP